MSTTRDRAVHGFIRDHARRVPDQLDRTPVTVERGVLLRAVYLLSRGAAAKAMPPTLQIALIDAGMALINADRADHHRRARDAKVRS